MPWSSVSGLVAGGFGILLVLLMCVTAGAGYQVKRHQAEIEELEFHSSRASLIQNVEAQAAIAGLLLQRYVDAGGDGYPDEINAHAAAAQLSLEKVLNMGGPPGFEDVTSLGLRLVRDASRAAELRRIGEVGQARVVLEEIVPLFRDYRLTLEAMAMSELRQVTALRAQADDSGNQAFWLLMGSGAIGVLLGIAVSVQILRSVIGPLGSLERTARKASEGDLSARAPATGPREFAHLGSVLNEMMIAIEGRTADLFEANSKLRETNSDLTHARNEAATDPLTGLGNHRSFHRQLREQIVATNAADDSIGLIIIDLDGFKEINDSLGHLAGDQVLRDLAVALTAVSLSENTYRYGGDELAVIVPDGDTAATIAVAERLKASVAAMPVTGGLNVTVSLGVACFPEAAATAEELVYHADMAMYWAKSTGKNRVVAWEDSLAPDSGMPRIRDAVNRPTHHDAIAGLCAALAMKDVDTRDHVERCSWYAGELALELGLEEEEVRTIRLSALLHDIGKLSVPLEILQKPGALSDAEFAVIQRHPVDGANIVASIPEAAPAVEAIRHHHKHFDGSGYPDGLVGAAIPLAARILLVTDAFDVMTNDRPYRKAWSIGDAIAELQRCAGTDFDPQIVAAFLRIVKKASAPILAGGTPAPKTTPVS